MSGKNKQTSIDWLIDKLDIILPSTFEWDKLEKVLEQAKEMDKEQKQFIFECGRNFQLTGEGTFQEIYNETFETK